MHEDDKLKEQRSGVSRRDFLKLGGIAATVPLVVSPRMVEAAGEKVAIHGPGKTPITLSVNGKKLSAELEPRVTLLDALRNQFDLTGAKRVCDRGNCGACSVLVDGKVMYACSLLAIDVQGRKIETIEGLINQLERSSEPKDIAALAAALEEYEQAVADHEKDYREEREHTIRRLRELATDTTRTSRANFSRASIARRAPGAAWTTSPAITRVRGRYWASSAWRRTSMSSSPQWGSKRPAARWLAV